MSKADVNVTCQKVWHLRVKFLDDLQDRVNEEIGVIISIQQPFEVFFQVSVDKTDFSIIK